MNKFSYFQTKNNGVDTDAFNVQFPSDRYDDVDKACKEVLNWALLHKEVKSISISDDDIHLHFIVEKDPCCAGNYLFEADVEFVIKTKTNDVRIESTNTSMNALAWAVVFFKDPYENESGDSDIVEKMRLIANRG